MLAHDRKKAATIIVASLHKPESGAPVRPEEELDGHDSELKGIAEDIIRAFADQSAHDLAMSLKAFIECCKEGPSDDDAKEDGDADEEPEQE